MTSPSIRWLDRVPSTQDAAHQLAGEGAPHGTAVAAREQTHGRGSRGRGWLSPAGGLWLSVVCRPGAASALQLLTIRVSLAVAAVLSERVSTAVAIKWPNDLMLADRKVGGVLAEARWVGDALAWIVVGVGINVTNRVSGELRSAAASLADVGYAGSPADLAGPIVTAVVHAAQRSGPLDAPEWADLAARDWLRGRSLSAPVAGVADGIGADGALQVRAADGAHAVRNGPVVLASSTLHA